MTGYVIELRKENKKGEDVITGISDVKRENIPIIVRFLNNSWVSEKRSIKIKFE